MQAADEDSVFAELYGNADIEPQSQAVVQQAIVPAALSHRLQAAEEDDFNIQLDEPDISGMDTASASQPSRSAYQPPPRQDAAAQGQLPGRPYAAANWQPSMPAAMALAATRPTRPLYVPAGATSVEQDNTAAFPMAAAPGQPIKLPGQTRVTSDEYREFLALGHGEIFDLELDRVVDAPWRVPGAEPGDFFNYGMDVRKWKDYATRVQQYRLEYRMQHKIATYDGEQGDTLDPDLPPELAAALAVERRQIQGPQGASARPLFRPQPTGARPFLRPPLPNYHPPGFPPAPKPFTGQQQVPMQARGATAQTPLPLHGEFTAGQPFGKAASNGEASTLMTATLAGNGLAPSARTQALHNFSVHSAHDDHSNGTAHGQQQDSGQAIASSALGAPQFSMAALPGPFVLGGLPLLPAPFAHPGPMLPPPFVSGGPSDQGTTRQDWVSDAYGRDDSVADDDEKHRAEHRDHGPPTGSLAMGMDAASDQPLRSATRKAASRQDEESAYCRQSSRERHDSGGRQGSDRRSRDYMGAWHGQHDRRRRRDDRYDDYEPRDRKRSSESRHRS